MTSAADPLKAVASPRRRRILALVYGRELAAGEIAAQLDVSWPAVSQNLNVLKGAGLLRERREGRRRLYSTDAEMLGPLAPMLERFWAEGLDRLAALAEAEVAARPGDEASV